MTLCDAERERIFQDCTHPLEEYKKVPVPLAVHIWLAQEVWHDTEFPLQRKGSLIPILQVCLALCFYATGCFQNIVGELIGVALSTACRTITRVTDALMLSIQDWTKLPMQVQANHQKQKFYTMRAIPSVIGCNDGTQIRIQGPNQQEHEFVNWKNHHLINVQVRQFCFTIQSAGKK